MLRRSWHSWRKTATCSSAVLRGTGVAALHRKEEDIMRSRRSYTKLAGIAAAALIAALTASPAAARGKTSSPSYACGVSVNPVTDGYGYALLGAGFPAGMGVTVYVADSVQTLTYKGTVNSMGTFSISATAIFSYTGTKTMYVNRTGDRKMVTYCSSSFLVQ
jgi:hypothetical protein